MKSNGAMLRSSPNIHMVGSVVFATMLVLAGLHLIDARSGGENESSPRLPFPVHVHVICSTADDGGRGTCDAAHRSSAFYAWTKVAVRRPQSTFTIWAVGSQRQEYHPVFVACIPHSWGAYATQAQTDFIQTGEDRAVAALTLPGHLPDGCAPPKAEVFGAHLVRVLARGLDLPDEVVEVRPDKAVGLNEAVVCDRSGTGRGVACTVPAFTLAYDQWMADTMEAGHGSFSVYQAGGAPDATQRLFDLSFAGLSPGEKLAQQVAARHELIQALGRPADTRPAPIVDAIAVAATELRQRAGDRRLTVLSELRRFAAGPKTAEVPMPAGTGFRGWLTEHQPPPDLHGIAVSVCGLHDARSPRARPSPAHGTDALQNTWQAALAAMGATDVTMRTACDGESDASRF